MGALTWGVTQESSLGKEGQLFRRRQKENLKMRQLLLLSMATLASCAPQSLVVTTTSLPCNSDEEGCIEVNTIPASSSKSTATVTIESPLHLPQPLLVPQPLLLR